MSPFEKYSTFLRFYQKYITFMGQIQYPLKYSTILYFYISQEPCARLHLSSCFFPSFSALSPAQYFPSTAQRSPKLSVPLSFSVSSKLSDSPHPPAQRFSPWLSDSFLRLVTAPLSLVTAPLRLVIAPLRLVIAPLGLVIAPLAQCKIHKYLFTCLSMFFLLFLILKLLDKSSISLYREMYLLVRRHKRRLF